eukprot:TRINITY_DN22059_c0_g1_i2.p1 TRINITY_DN22059_c0_g1~~TRINITY_DN22059_c0_g1_i2.p1  ORF type:complete len:207 (-),score=35.06 TRINITY_DN22059_c0_g1_i2:35-655(-)
MACMAGEAARMLQQMGSPGLVPHWILFSSLRRHGLRILDPALSVQVSLARPCYQDPVHACMLGLATSQGSNLWPSTPPEPPRAAAATSGRQKDEKPQGPPPTPPPPPGSERPKGSQEAEPVMKRLAARIGLGNAMTLISFLPGIVLWGGYGMYRMLFPKTEPLPAPADGIADVASSDATIAAEALQPDTSSDVPHTCEQCEQGESS